MDTIDMGYSILGKTSTCGETIMPVPAFKFCIIKTSCIRTSNTINTCTATLMRLYSYPITYFEAGYIFS